jgi:hypothetical protein
MTSPLVVISAKGGNLLDDAVTGFLPFVRNDAIFPILLLKAHPHWDLPYQFFSIHNSMPESDPMFLVKGMRRKGVVMKK